jgi:hypothetical protein
MIQNYKIVTLCGSTRFKEQFMEVQKRLTVVAMNSLRTTGTVCTYFRPKNSATASIP